LAFFHFKGQPRPLKAMAIRGNLTGYLSGLDLSNGTSIDPTGLLFPEIWSLKSVRLVWPIKSVDFFNFFWLSVTKSTLKKRTLMKIMIQVFYQQKNAYNSKIFLEKRWFLLIYLFE
jgi:hypothetical protein